MAAIDAGESQALQDASVSLAGRFVPSSSSASAPAAAFGVESGNAARPHAVPTFEGGSHEDSAPGEMRGVGPEMRSTLDESVRETILRDLKSIVQKLGYVMLPTRGIRRDRGRRLKDWDLWGPLILCLALGSVLAVQQDSGEQASYAFADVFVTVWLGAGIVTLNALLLRGQVSFFQTVCVLGYCLAPLVIAAALGLVLGTDCSEGSWSCVLKVLLVAGALVWAAKASIGFVAELVPEDRKWLGLYPVWLFYVAIAWMIVLS